MTIEKKISIDEITVSEAGHVFVRETALFAENGQEITKAYKRTSFVPGADVSNQPAKVQAICAAAWTPEIVATYQATLTS